MVKAKDGFFAVSLDQFRKISEQHGMPECCLYLIYCCGSDRTNTHTMWSKNALTKRTSISVRRAQRAEQNLIDGGYVTKLRDGKHPKFRIERSELDDAAWLPKAFVEGAVSENSPLELIKRTGDHMILRLIIDLYWYQNIADDAGIRQVYLPYEQRLIATHGQYNIFEFSKGAITSVELDAPFLGVHRNESCNQPCRDFWERFTILVDLGLIYEIPTLFDSDDGEPLVSLKAHSIKHRLPNSVILCMTWVYPNL